MAAAEALIATISRAFYDDDVVCLIDVLLRDKYLRDDDMAPRLSLPAKQLRRTLQFMEEEQLVKHELVDDLAMGGSQNTKFWYIDYNHAVHVIRLRIHLLQTKLHAAEMRARSSSSYLCPGYAAKACNGRYDETDAQQIVDPETGLFLCRECVRAHANNPDPPPKSSYTLRLLDNQREVAKAMNDMRRVRVQLSSKMMEDSTSNSIMQSSSSSHHHHQQPLRRGIFELIQKVRSSNSSSSAKGVGGGREPITSNLPSENIAMGIGSKRLAGTGRTAGILLKKQQRQGIVPLPSSSSSASGGGITAAAAHGGGGGARRSGGLGDGNNGDELTFLKNAIGQEIAFELEKGGGARANLLATRGRIRNKLIDAAAMKVGVDIGLVARVIIHERERQLQRRREEEKERREMEIGGGDSGKRKKQTLCGGGEDLHFLRDNLGALSSELVSREEKKTKKMRRSEAGRNNSILVEGKDYDVSSDAADDVRPKRSYYITDETDELWNLPEDDRRAAFQAQYKAEVERQKKLLGISSLDDITFASFHSRLHHGGCDDDEDDEETENIAWEDG